MHKKLILALILVSALSFSLDLIYPKTADIRTGQIIDLGSIGPGQTVLVQIDPIVKTGGIYGEGGQYDYAIASELPNGWTAADSKLYQNQLHVTITAPPDAPPGNYTAKITVVDERNGEHLGNVTFIAKVKITWDVMDFDVTPKQVTAGPGQPASLGIKIVNKGSTSDVFRVSLVGPRKWQFTKEVFVPAETTKEFHYEIAGTEDGTYPSTLKIVSLASKNIAAEKNVTLTVKSDLWGDFKATNHGTLVFPIFESVAYSFAGLISNLFG
ncbi:hypothetical protein HY988_06855 [Candidatus Micrarchaeota archaeon]|nr:hypothetical protein [Candidatus Micrarchaeota archaeon]